MLRPISQLVIDDTHKLIYGVPVELLGTWHVTHHLAGKPGVTLKRVKLDHERSALVLEPLDLDFKPLILDGDQTSEVFLIGTLAVQLQLCGNELNC